MFSLRHKITLEEYGELYINGSGSNAPQADVLISEDNESRKYPVPKNIAWFDRCAFKCKGCDFIVFSSNGQEAHLKKCPSLAEIGKRAANFELVERIIHDCRICGSKVQHDRNAITNHLRSHDVKLSDYAVTYKPYKTSNPDALT